jgi:hypothetical protein
LATPAVCQSMPNMFALSFLLTLCIMTCQHSERLKTKWLYPITNMVPKSGRSRFMIQLLAADQEVASLATPPFIADVAVAVVALGAVKLGYVEGKLSDTADELV